MRFHYIICILFLSFSAGAAAQPASDSLRKIVDQSLQLMEENSLHRSEINWKDFRKKVYKQTAGINNLDSLINQYPLFFKWLNDFHGAVTLDGRWIKWREGKPLRPLNAMIDSVLTKGPRLKVARFGDIGYYRVPSPTVLANEIPKATQRYADSLCTIDPATVKAWIIDLRTNTGGNFWPMVTSIATVLGDGVIGGIKYIDNRKTSDNYIEQGKVYANNQFYTIPDNKCAVSPSGLPVVVLVSGATGSSGESMALAFKGRPNTIMVGETTSGYVTSNNNWALHPRVNLFLATGFMKDRKGQHYTDGIIPDVEIRDGDDLYDMKNDRKIRYAIEWLNKKLDKSK
ncbi:S41 family peptidase [Sediminibacterium ginsengisoli]|uniref:Peptidase family S41 n=1 Tax=Sediminibacterium ginsengisoli TaxID=413434 RepID=A0A1T4RT93_9BACT|nr:S41 family peptidase [Sediminibacterium ginsengisoli]SKA19215.1 Peptidase family S41 [Sediminibacterium ginsengisoli]